MKQSHNFCAGSLKKGTSVLMLIVFALVVGIGTPVLSFAAEGKVVQVMRPLWALEVFS